MSYRTPIAKKHKNVNCDCMLCKDQHAFKISNELMRELLHGNVTLFAGAGISTEAKSVMKNTFYESVAAEIRHASPLPPFPDLMEQYCLQLRSSDSGALLLTLRRFLILLPTAPLWLVLCYSFGIFNSPRSLSLSKYSS